jgi:hypothetical protein
MFDNVRRRLPVAIAVLMSVAITGGGTLAQSGDEVSPSAIQSINVQKVDNLSAVKSTSNLNKRKGKLMAVGASGYYPNDIIVQAMDSALLDGIDSAAFATLAALASPTGAVNQVDNPVHWNQIQGVPAAVLLADTTRSFIAATSGLVPVNGTALVAVGQPLGLDVETTLIPVTEGALFSLAPFAATIEGELYLRSAGALVQYLLVRNVGVVPSAVRLRATVWNDGFLAPSAARNQVTAKFILKSPKQLLRQLTK